MGVPIQAVKRRGFLRQMAELAKRTTSGLKETLVGVQSGHFVNTFSRGRLVVSQSGSGQSGSFQIEMHGEEWTQSNVFGLVEELIELCESLTTDDLPDDSTPSATDALFQAMLDDASMHSSRVQYGDFTLLGAENS